MAFRFLCHIKKVKSQTAVFLKVKMTCKRKARFQMACLLFAMNAS